MPSHFSTIGMPVKSEEQMYEIVEKASQDAEEIKCEVGSYLKWSSPDGAELWLQMDKENNLVGVTPSFRGESSINVGITNAVIRPDDTPFEGAIHGWANPNGTNVESGEYPFVFDLVDKALYGSFDFPFISDVSLSAFAHELTVYDSEDEYDSMQVGKAKFAVESFIPSGLFDTEDNSGSGPQPFAIFTGRVLKEKEYINPLTGINYHWALVKTLGGTIDLVTDPKLINKPIKVDGIVSGSFWLNGKIKNPKVKNKQGFLGRFFGK